MATLTRTLNIVPTTSPWFPTGGAFPIISEGLIMQLYDSSPVGFEKFPSTLGNLISVGISFNLNVAHSRLLENYDSTSAHDFVTSYNTLGVHVTTSPITSTYSPTLQNYVISDPGRDTFGVFEITYLSKEFSATGDYPQLTAFDGSWDNAGTSGKTLSYAGPQVSSVPYIFFNTAPYLNWFRGTAPGQFQTLWVSITETMIADPYLSNFCAYYTRWIVSGTITITYTY